MLISFFDANGNAHKEFVPPGQTVNQQILFEGVEKIMQWCTEKTTRNVEQR